MFQEHAKKIYLIAWDQQIQPLDCHMFLLQVVSPQWVNQIPPMWTTSNRARKKLEFQLVLWASSSNFLVAQGHTLLA